MRRKFLTWLLLLVCATFVVTGGLAYHQFDRQVQQRAHQILHTRLNDLAELIKYTDENMKHVVEINNETTLHRARAAAEIIKHNPALLNSKEQMRHLCNELGADQLCVADAKGIIIAAVPEKLEGFDMTAHDQSSYFLPCIDSPGTELVQRARKNADTGEFFQYAGVGRRDKPGIVELGFSMFHEKAVRSNTGFANITSRFKLGENGMIVAFRGGALINGADISIPTADLLSLPLHKTQQTEIGDGEYYTHVIQNKDIRIIGLLPAKEINEVSMESLRQLFISNIWLFIVMFLLVWVLLQKLVLNGLSRINHSLQRITEGYKEERVNVRDTPEFTQLSTGINTMVDSLRLHQEQRRERLQKEFAMARSVQNTVLPNKFPAFPDYKQFDLYASRLQSENVGGDFYDFFMADNEHLCFMLGDVSTTGIPGALFMMHAMSVIRSLAASGCAPAELLTEANKTLCENNVTKTRISFFLARLNINTGVLRFINAGTPQALRSSNGVFEMMPMRSGTVLGAHNNSIYRECIVALEPGDRILLYSQGILKATDASKVPFGAARLQNALTAGGESVTDLIRAVQVELRSFTGNKEQSTDCTLLAVEFKGKWQQKKDFCLTPGDAEALTALTQNLSTMLESVLAAPVAMAELESTLTDIISALPTDDEVNMTIRCNEEVAEVDMRYRTPHFNPLEQLPTPPPDSSLYSTHPTEGSTLKLTKSLA